MAKYGYIWCQFSDGHVGQHLNKDKNWEWPDDTSGYCDSIYQGRVTGIGRGRVTNVRPIRCALKKDHAGAHTDLGRCSLGIGNGDLFWPNIDDYATSQKCKECVDGKEVKCNKQYNRKYNICRLANACKFCGYPLDEKENGCAHEQD